MRRRQQRKWGYKMGGRGSGGQATSKQKKRLSGNPGKRVEPVTPEPEPLEESIQPPFDLGEYGNEEWIRIIDELIVNKIITKLDMVTLAGYCVLYQQFRVFVELSQQRGLTEEIAVFGRGKQLSVTHVVVGLQKTIAAMRPIANDLGLSPSARMRMELTEGAREDRVESFMEAGVALRKNGNRRN